MPDQATELERLSPTEKRALARRLVADRAEAARRAGACLHRLFEAEAEARPDAAAVTFEGRTLSYAALNARANRLARRLRALGVGPETFVGIYADRSAEMVVGLLAVLKAGGAYVPIDTAYPADRVAFLLADARVPILLTRPHLLDAVPAHDAAIVDLDDPCPGEPGENLPGGDLPANAAYVIYTSGSTGAPKGVVVTHANVARLLAGTRRAFGFGPADVWTLFHSFAFDFSVWEVWGALAHGGRLVVVPYWVSRSPEAFLGLLRDERVTVLNQTPSAFRQLVRADGEAGGGGLALRWVVFGGEALEPESLRPWFDRRGDRRPTLVNMYGITETTVHVTQRPVNADDLDAGRGASPIGVAIPGWSVRLLDARMQPVPVGVVGEVFVGGAGLARGYLGRPGLTAERFVPDPFSREPGARLYRSGDLARRRPDGTLDYVGRSDHQVKVRGFRIEPGEVEAALRKHPGVADAAVLAREFGPDDRRLVAYVVGPSAGSADLRRWLKPRLPEYMVPSAFVALDALPLTHHGKLDRDALPEPSFGASAGEPPSTALEATIAAAWVEVLGRDAVGRTDDFFDLGGHSLLATQVASRVREATGIDVPLRALFEAPTVAGLAERIEGMTPDRAGPGAPLVRVDRDGPAPASFAQEALWFLDRLAPGEPVFHVSAAVRVLGPLDLDVLARAFDEIVRRHEALRTRFATADGRPVQVVDPAGVAGLARVEAADPAEAARLASEEAARPFDLERGPLARALAIRLGQEDHAVVLTMHHVVTDGWSFGVAGRELSALYGAFRRGEPSPLLDLPVQYADYALWQRERLQGARLDALLAYWTGRLAGVPDLDLPTDRPRPPRRSARGGLRRFAVGPGLAGRVRALGRAEGATPFMTLLAAFQALLGRQSGQEDFAVGSPVANRTTAEVEGLIGYFINMLVLRADLSGGPSFRALLGRVRGEAVGAYEHQELRLERLVEAHRPARDLSRTPLFQAMFVFQNNEVPDLSRGDLTLAPFDFGPAESTAKFDLTLAMADDGPGMVGSFEYDADLFDGSTVDRWTGHFLALLEAATGDPDRPVADLPLLTPEERDRLDAWNATAFARPADARVHRLFEVQADARPDAVALEGEFGSWTYAELDRRANRLAHRLRALGVGPEVRVGLLVDRSPAAAVGILGVLKAGGAYVPVDPAYPPDRVTAMLADARPAVVLTRDHLRDRVPVGLAVVDLDATVEGPEARPAVEVPADAAAYVIYTSGSTGEPRGVLVTHAALANHALAAADLFGLGPEDRVLQFASLSFDIAVEELFPAWSRGASVVLRGGDETLEPSRFNAWVADRRVTVLDLPTAYWHAWVGGLGARGGRLPGSLRLAVVGGEKALASAYRTWRSLGGDRVRWLNTYGPTEATVIASAFEPGETEPAGEIPIGGPIANARLYVLDGRLNPAPVGVPGELFLGGLGVARGYLDRPGATAERFLPDPFGLEPGARMFRTGDRVRRRADGLVEFLGRVDAQVKVRGHRVEPGEVEAAILAHPGVREALVKAGDDPSGETRLDAYFVGEVGADALRRFLRDRLPRPLVPSTFTRLDALPTTPSGKVDRKALPAPEGSEAREAVAPRDDLEARLVAVWEEVLDVRPVGVTDGFFDLGGHSLLAIRLLGRVEEEFGRRLDLGALFLGPTVEDLAALLRGPVGRSEGSPVVAIQPRGEGPAFACVHPAGGIVYCFGELARRLGDDRPFLALQSPGLDGGPTFSTVEAMAAAYVEALRGDRPGGPYHLGGWSLGGLVAFEMARQLEAAGEPVVTVALLDTRAPAAGGPVVPESLKALAVEVAALGLFGGETDPEADALVLAEFAGDLVRGFGGGASKLVGHLKRLDPDARRAYLLNAFRLDEVYHLETGPERVGRLWNVLRANLLAAAKYRPGGYGGRVAVFRAADGPRAAADLGWSRLARGGVSTHTVPGDHAGILKPPGVVALAEALRREIDGGAS